MGETAKRVLAYRRKKAAEKAAAEKPVQPMKKNQTGSYGMGPKDGTEPRAKTEISPPTLDFELCTLGTELAVFHIEAGTKSFIRFARRMVEGLGAKAKPFLKSWYLGAKYFPGIDNSGMDSEEVVDALDIDDITMTVMTRTGGENKV